MGSRRPIIIAEFAIQAPHLSAFARLMERGRCGVATVAESVESAPITHHYFFLYRYMWW